MGALYRLDFPNGKSYVGITSGTVEGRFREHVEMSQRPKRWAVHRAIAKYGADSVKCVTLAISDSWAYLCHVEQRAIEVFGTYKTGGYNLTKGGEGFRGSHTPEAKAKIAAASSVSKLGTKASAKTRALLSAAHKGMRVSEEAKRKLSEALRGRPKSEETKAKLSAAHKGRKKSPEHVAKMAAAKRGKTPAPQSPEAREKTRVGLLTRGGGVSFNKKLQKWAARINVMGVRFHLGVFATEKEARAVRAAATANAILGIKP